MPWDPFVLEASERKIERKERERKETRDKNLSIWITDVYDISLKIK